jgi:soluble lytic murein transglycosylase
LWFDRYRELDTLAQVDDATSELAAASDQAPPQYRAPVGALLSQRYAQQGDVGRGIAMAEQVRDSVGGTGHGLPLILWEALYPQAFWETITKAAARSGANPYLVAGVIREESRFDPRAISPANAYGLMQLLPGTARGAARLAGVPAPGIQGLFDPDTNILLGSVVLQELWVRYNRVDLALAAYNAGPGAVGQWQAQRGGLDPEAFVEEIPYLETRNYVKTVMQSAAMYKWLYRDGHPSMTP